MIAVARAMRCPGRGWRAAATAFDAWLEACRNCVATCLSPNTFANPTRCARWPARAKPETANLASAVTFGLAATCFTVPLSRDARRVALTILATAFQCRPANSEMRNTSPGCRRTARKPTFLICLFILHLPGTVTVANLDDRSPGLSEDSIEPTCASPHDPYKARAPPPEGRRVLLDEPTS